jgi:hypothetical protein
VWTQPILVPVEEQGISELSAAWGLRSVVVAMQSFVMSLDRRYMKSLDLPLYRLPHLVSSILAFLQQRCLLAAGP